MMLLKMICSRILQGMDVCSWMSWFLHTIWDQLVDLQKENVRLSERLSELEQSSTKKLAVSTHVGISGSLPVAGTAKVMYDVEITNIGNAFNFQTGKFIAPVSGVYMFHVTACLGDGGQWMILNIMGNDNVIGRVFTGDNSYHACGSKALSVHLKTSDSVWVQRAAGSSVFLSQDHGWNSFTAVLLDKD
ncbi:complement C1q-like protein 4 [Ruditapes philippinarum]|uniref:complement C1q-like protein 4 n=1 Tax=Ruditapes philippinarum TaxID=129788 RepID=UPI00295BD663|nr:complement C1q-like protein 4 [Ruditapes philippinarum]